MIFITEDDHETEQNHKLSFSHLLGSGHAGAVYLSKAEGYNALVMAYDEKTTLQRLRKFAEKKKNLHFIFFSEDETFNLSRASKILASEQFYGLKDYVYTYCHARKRMLNLALLEELGPEEHIQNASSKHLKLVDSSVLAIQRLKADPEAQPVNFMELETVKVGNAQKTTGAVKGAFHAMVIGFSETGQEALSFLYEYGAFVGTDGNAAPFRCVVLDKDMSQIEGTYYAKRPALKTKENIILKTAAVGSKAFWAAVDEEICQLNYVIIALGDDQLNTSVAVDLYNHMLLKNGDIPRHFVIYVRLNKRQRKEIKGISSFYFGQSNTDSVIRFFGSEEEVYSDKFVINNEDEQKALQFANVYDTFNEKYKAKKTKNEVVKEKEKQQPQAQPKPKSKSDKLEFLLKQRNARRAFIQNLSNARHILTKVALLTNQMTDWENLDALQQLVRTPNVSDFKGQYFYRMNNANEEISPELADYYSGLMLNVARCEHERWIRSHEMLGYTPFERPEMRGKDIAQKHHDCMLPWNDLLNRWENGGEEVDDEVLCYDYNVVETSIHLYVAEHAAELEQWRQQQKTIKH